MWLVPPPCPPSAMHTTLESDMLCENFLACPVFFQLIDKWIHILFCRSNRTPDKASNISSLQLQVPSDNYTKLFSYRREAPGMSNTTFLRIYENQCRQRTPAERRSPHLALCPCVSPYLGKRHIPVEDSNSSQTQKRTFESNANQFVACSRWWVMAPAHRPSPPGQTPSSWTETPPVR